MKKIYSFLGWAMCAGWLTVSGANAQWLQNDDTGPYDYNDFGNWVSGSVNGSFTGSTQPGLTVTFDHNTALSTGTSIRITNSASSGDITFLGDGGNYTLTVPGDIYTLTVSGTKYYTFGSVVDGEQLSVNLVGNRTISVAQGQTVVFVNEVTISGGNLVKTGNGSLAFANDTNGFAADIRVDAGKLIFSSIADEGVASSLGKSGVIELVAGGTAPTNTHKLQFGGRGVIVSADSTSNRTVKLSGTADYFYLDNQVNYTLTLTGDFINAATGAANKTFIISGVKGAVTELSGVIGNASISGATGITVAGEDGAGTPFVARLTGSANTFSGAVTLGYNTVLEVTKLADRGQASSVGTGLDDDRIVIGGTSNTYGATLRYIGETDSTTDRRLEFGTARNNTNTIVNDSPTNSNLTFTNSGDWKLLKKSGTYGNDNLRLQGTSTGTTTIMGRIVDADSDERNKLTLTVSGSGVWRLTNDSTYTGNTTVSGGTLLVDGALAGTGTVTVSAGAKLGGSGTINAASALSVSGRLVPGGDNAVGTLTVGALTLLTGSVLVVDINSDTLTADLLRATSAVNLGNGVASLLAGIDFGNSLLAENSVFTILQTDSLLSGRFANDEVRIGDNLFYINYTSNAVLLQVIPEPNSAFLITVGGLFLALIVRKMKS